MWNNLSFWQMCVSLLFSVTSLLLWHNTLIKTTWRRIYFYSQSSVEDKMAGPQSGKWCHFHNQEAASNKCHWSDLLLHKVQAPSLGMPQCTVGQYSHFSKWKEDNFPYSGCPPTKVSQDFLKLTINTPELHYLVFPGQRIYNGFITLSNDYLVAFASRLWIL